MKIETMPPSPRFDRLDALRALAIVWMAVFHFCFDLNHLGLWDPRQAFTRDPFWTWQRTAIVSLFLLCAGLGQAVAFDARQTWPRFWRRWAQVAGCAVLVSAGSALMFPNTWIHFGVLHGMAVMLVLARLAAPLGAWLWPLGALALALPRVLQHASLDGPWLNWLGLVTRKPLTEDYVPVLPWLGVMLWGRGSGCCATAAVCWPDRWPRLCNRWRCWGAGRCRSTCCTSRCCWERCWAAARWAGGEGRLASRPMAHTDESTA
jgi:uncharacterized membrane protein